MAIPFREHLAGPYDALVHDVMQSAIRNQVVERLWSKDHRLWKPEPTEIADRLGWLTLPGDMLAHVQSLKTLAVTAGRRASGTSSCSAWAAAASAPKSFVRRSAQRRVRRVSWFSTRPCRDGFVW